MNILELHLSEDIVGNRSSWRRRIKKLIQASLHQQKKLLNMSAYVPSYLPQPEREEVAEWYLYSFIYLAWHIIRSYHGSVIDEPSRQDHSFGIHDHKEEPLPLPKEKKGRGSPPVWYITADELDSLSSYMRGRLTLDKINAAINDMAAYAEANSQLMTAPRKKEIRDIGATEGVKGKHFFLETDVKGPTLKLDNTGKAIFTVLRHLGRLSESRIKNHRVFVLLRPH
ncbi:putative spindle and kinetochore-associated protein [Helianthus annuus]|nr:putative spindle and kinetochore-associated protein [Helianthus annuus]